jgi:hypothetical protein
VARTFTLQRGETLTITHVRDRDGYETAMILRCVTGKCTITIPEKFLEDSAKLNRGEDPALG